jgi:hypothetical protein
VRCAERREPFGRSGTRWACHLASKTRVNALLPRHALAGPIPVFSCFSADSESSIPGLTISSTHTHTSSFPRRMFAPGVLQLGFAHPNRGVGGAPRDVRVRARHPRGVPSCVKDARERAYDAAHQALARRLASHDAANCWQK